MAFVKRENWTEDQVNELPSGEHDYFDRKSGVLFDAADGNNLLDTLAKAASAFANSGGGHLILGVTDAGVPDGVPRISSGRTTTRDWLEQKLPQLLDYRLGDFRVHVVILPMLQGYPKAARCLSSILGTVHWLLIKALATTHTTIDPQGGLSQRLTST